MEESSSIKVTPDAYYALKSLKKIFKEKYGRTYSISDLIVVGNLLTLSMLETNTPVILDITEEAKLLRLKKNRGESRFNIFETLKQEHLPKLSTLLGGKSRDSPSLVIDIINTLLDEEYLDAATLVLFEHKNMIGDETFKELSARILEKQVSKKK